MHQYGARISPSLSPIKAQQEPSSEPEWTIGLEVSVGPPHLISGVYDLLDEHGRSQVCASLWVWVGECESAGIQVDECAFASYLLQKCSLL